MSSEPTTEAGKRLLNDDPGILETLPYDMGNAIIPDVLLTHILAIEAEVRADLEAKVRALPLPDDLDDEIVVRNYRAAVLRLLTDGAEPPKTGEPR